MLVLSLFPGIGLLDMAFEEEGFCVVRGPDLLWGGDIKRFHPPSGKFDGVIGGPPCQKFSAMRSLNHYAGQRENLIPEFERIVREARPNWFLMENVPASPLPNIPVFKVTSTILNNRWVGGEQRRVRRFTFGSMQPVRPLETFIQWESLEQIAEEATVLGGHDDSKYIRQKNGRSRSLSEKAIAQGLPADFLAHAILTRHGKHLAIGNGVPLPMGRAIAKAVRKALA